MFAFIFLAIEGSEKISDDFNYVLIRLKADLYSPPSLSLWLESLYSSYF